MRLHTNLVSKTRSSKRLRLGALFAFLLSVYGIFGNWDDAYSVWNRLTVWMLGAVHLRADQVPYPDLLALAVFLVVAAIGFWIARYVLARADRREANARGVSLRVLRDKRARSAYLDYLSDDLENRLRSSIHQACFI